MAAESQRSETWTTSSMERIKKSIGNCGNISVSMHRLVSFDVGVFIIFSHELDPIDFSISNI